METADLANAVAEKDVDAAAGHVRRERHCTLLPGAGDDPGLAVMVLGIEDLVLQAMPVELLGKPLTLVDRGGADEHRLAKRVSLLHFLDDRGPATDIWSTMVVFGKEDSCTVCGVTEKGFTIDASDLGKLKMAMQVVAITLIILRNVFPWLTWFSKAALWLVVIFALAFYVAYTLWYGFGLMWLFEGMGLKIGH